MSHSEHDLDLIAAYAAGYADDRAAAEALLSSCSACAAEYSQQLAVKQMLKSLPAASLTQAEAADLHSSVLSQLPSPVTDLAAVRARKPLSPVWGRMTAVAAAVAGVVLVGTVITSGGGGASATTTAPFESLAGAESGDRAAMTTSATEETFAAETAQGDAQILLTDGSLEDLAKNARDLAAQFGSGAGATATTDAAAPATTAAPSLAYDESCPDLTELRVLASAETFVGDRPVVILIVDGDPEPVARAFYIDDCSEITLPD